MFKENLKIIIYLAAFGLLTACGGGSGSGSDSSGSGSDDNNAGTTLVGKEVSTGTITGFGSVFVNGTRYDTSAASVNSDDSTLNDVTELKVGMVATVTSDSSVASSVSYEENIKGPVDSQISDFSAPISVMSQTVIVDSATVIDASLSFPVDAGDVLEISGIRQSDDSILATYIESKNLDTVKKFKVIVNAREIKPTAKTFKIGGLTVDYTDANADELLGGNPSDGQLVEVKDDAKTYSAGSGTLVATKVEAFDTFSGNGDDNSTIANVQIESVVIGGVTDANQFEIPNFTVNILPSTTFLFGTVADIGVGSVLSVKAVRSDDGELDATRIKFKRNSARMTASVDTAGVNVADNQLTVMGVTVQLNSDTDMRDKLNDVSAFEIDDISDNDYLEIRGFTSTNGIFVANRLERDDEKDRVDIRGIATNIDPVAQTLEILGLTITAGSSTQFNDGAASVEEFFSALTEGLSIVQVKWGSLDITGIDPEEMEIEDDFSLSKL